MSAATLPDIDSMPAGPEMDAMVADRMFGHVVHHAEPSRKDYKGPHSEAPKPYSSDDSAAIEASHELQGRGYRIVVQQEVSEVTVYVGRRNAPIAEDVKATAATFALAFSRAALKAGAR